MVHYFASWTNGGDALTCELAGVLLQQCLADVGSEAEEESIFGVGGIPGRSFSQRILEGRPELQRVRPDALEGIRAVASTPEAVAKTFAAFRFICDEFCYHQGITGLEHGRVHEERRRADEEVRGQGDCPPGRRPPGVCRPVRAELSGSHQSRGHHLCGRVTLPPVRGGGGQRQAIPICCRGESRGHLAPRPPDDGAEVHRRERPGLDRDPWETFSWFAARHLEGRGRAKWKVLLMDGCKVHASAVDLGVLKDAKAVVLNFSSHLAHILEALDGQPFPKIKARSVTETGEMLSTLIRGGKSNLIHLMKLINQR